MSKLEIPLRLRRLRRTASVRALVQQTRVGVDDLIYPLFVREGGGAAEPVASMPGVGRHSLEGLVAEARAAHELGIRAIAIFPVTPATKKDPRGREALNPKCLVLRAVRAVKKALPDLIVITDIALDPYTSHGHDGVLHANGRDVDNDATVVLLAKMAVLQAEAGADWVAPSDMMDGRVRAIRAALDAAEHKGVAILSYAAKFASAYYGPFREAVGSQQAAGKTYLDKRTYQLNPANPREAWREAALDAHEGADILMVKPAGAYLDILHALRQRTDMPLAAYQVSGEYAQIHAAAQLGWLDLAATRDEALLAIKRAGADLILTYFAKDVARALR
ncbi:MAG: porphobilinogen synthase [Pedosphaera sp.]|nr:porphobilinogen synthase [Pedosphaera sp.]MSU43852.1 porphobilinogen synthase [Pedosphaera sp.]